MKRRQWLAYGLGEDVDAALDRIERLDDVVVVAVMPDVHLASDVCVGTVTATRHSLIPNAVGGDIGCGMQALAFDADANAIDDRDTAAAILSRLYARVPIIRHRRDTAPELPAELESHILSGATLEAKKRRANLQLGTVGRGNHFVELQRDDEGRLWAMVHSGSRGMGQAIRAHHLEHSSRLDESTVRALDAREPKGRAYLSDVQWARGYARENRTRIMQTVAGVLAEVIGAESLSESRIEADHNHVQSEQHDDATVWVHRKGAQSARKGEAGIIPGSMGSSSFHVVGRGCAEALTSSSHGAGRAMSRTEARKKISRAKLDRDTRGIWFDRRLMGKLREEAPAAYKDIDAVMRAQRELVRITRKLDPVLVFKGA